MEDNNMLQETDFAVEMEDIPSYEGDEPYVFISYSHSDAVEVNGIIQQLVDQRIRFFFDRSGIKAGDNWEETLGEKIRNCHVFCEMTSEKYWSSAVCKHEVQLAVGKLEKPCLEIKLQSDVERPDEFWIMQGDSQSICVTDFADLQAFTNKLCESPVIQECQEPLPESVDPALLKAANVGDAFAESRIGYCYEQSKDFAQAIDWYVKAVDQGNEFAASRLGYCYDMSAWQAYVLAFEAHIRMAEKGNAYCQYETGFHYEKGLGIDRNVEKALEWYKKADENGYEKAGRAYKRLSNSIEKQ